NGKTISFTASAVTVPTGSGQVGSTALVTDGAGNSTIYLGTGATTTATVGDVLSAIDLASGVKTASIASGAATLSTASNTTASSVTTAGELAI
ncbi:DUF1522 domain-containing protein, partial [Acinetobacter baumannii]